ncbi:MAG: hypothetical protein R2734_15660 [Nocardioides sp.]
MLVTSAFAGSARGVARYGCAAGDARGRSGARGGCPALEAAHHPRSVAWLVGGRHQAAIRAVARADADIKGAASDAPYTLERLVLTIAGLREPR